MGCSSSVPTASCRESALDLAGSRSRMEESCVSQAHAALNRGSGPAHRFLDWLATAGDVERQGGPGALTSCHGDSPEVSLGRNLLTHVPLNPSFPGLRSKT